MMSATKSHSVVETELATEISIDSKNGPVSFEFPSTPPPPRTSKDWKCVLMEIKRLYQRRLYKQCAARCETILHNANKENIHPIYRAFLTFYAAVSYEFLGRAAHLYSANKIKLLSLALEKFVDCGAALPPLVALPRLSKREDDYSDLSSPSSPSAAECLATFEPPSPRRNSLVAGITRLIDASLIEMDDPFLGIEDGMDEKFSILSSLDFQPFEDQPILSQSKVSSTVKDPMKKESMKPFPLRVIKSSNENHSCTTIMPRKSIPNDANCGITRSNSRFRPPRLPLQVITSFQLNARKQKETCVSTASDSSSPTYTAHLSSTEHSFLETPNTTPPSQTSSKETFPFPVDDLTPARAAQIVRSNHGLAFLREQINSSIYEIEIQTHHITRIQELRRERKLQRASSFWSFDPIIGDYEDMELVMDPEPIMNEFGNLVLIETKQQRIVRLRAEGWETVGLRSRGSTWKGSRYYQELCAMVMTELNLDS